MSRIRFQLIQRYLHFNDSNTAATNEDRLYKICTILDIVVNKFRTNYITDKEISPDEIMLSWQDHLQFRVYNRSKIKKYGILVGWVCESSTGYICNLQIYDGKCGLCHLWDHILTAEELKTDWFFLLEPIPAGLQASFPCKLNYFRKRVKNVVTSKGNQVGVECEKVKWCEGSDVEWTDMIYVKWYCFEVNWVTVKFLGTKVPWTLGWPYTEGNWLHCDYFIWRVSRTVVDLTSCNMWVWLCVCVGL